jgi:hypothetical protein
MYRMRAPFRLVVTNNQGLFRSTAGYMPNLVITTRRDYSGRAVLKFHEVVPDPAHNGHKTVARQNISKNEVIFSELGDVLSTPNVYTVQTGEHSHVMFTGEAKFLAHSFSPNLKALIYPTRNNLVEFITIRDINKGESLSFNYCTTEWSVAAPFVDSEMGKSCKGFIAMSPEEKLEAMNNDLLPPHILRMWVRELLSNQK